ncbi:hypothetical protein BKA67DRAFT_684452 [Truncatella angustata]|uniref:Uncharacterized protein n=1 Tax=Truncatella angustata TaxID=152316 RepID=A0A9P8RP08_9PEZI|nr:uncharacterized protein BKA67DRAFT_684452 [Truncatella angustata]KAH6646980.1 hypothetical protein BKA67DRAFT_684452 [Truncatella angustata]
MDILRPFTRIIINQRSRMRTFTALKSFPLNAFTASVNQLKWLVLEYRNSQEASTYSIL